MSSIERGARLSPDRVLAFEMMELGANAVLGISDPSLDEVMASPLVHLVMRRDGLTPDDVWRVIRTAQHRMNHSACDRRDLRCG